MAPLVTRVPMGKIVDASVRLNPVVLKSVKDAGFLGASDTPDAQHDLFNTTGSWAGS